MSSRPPIDSLAAERRQRQSRLARSALGTGAGTLISRITGLFRVVILVEVLGQTQVADAFNVANNTPNIIHDLVLGGVLAATFVPVFVDRLATRPAFEANESISAVVTVSSILLLVSTVVFVAFAPQIIDLYSLSSHSSVPPQERALATELLRYFAPQLLFYGAISLMSAVLATRDRFASVGFVPIVNNVVSIVVLAIFAAAFHPTHGESWTVSLEHHHFLVVFLGLGTTLGVALQALALVPSMRRAGIRLHFVFRPKDSAIRLILSLSGWTFGFILANQLAVFVVLALAWRQGAGDVSAYTYGYIFFQFPFAIVASSIINVASPDLARLYTARKFNEVGVRFGVATRQVLALILPSMVGYLILARPAMELALGHHSETLADTRLTAAVLALFALGLPGYCVFFLATRTLQAMQDTKAAFWLYVLENGVNIVLAFALYRPLGVKGLALSYSIAYTVAAIAALLLLRDNLGTIGGRLLVQKLLHYVALSLLMAFVVAFISAIFGTDTGLIGWVKLIITIFIGLGAYIVGAGVAGSVTHKQNARRKSVAGIHSKGRHGDPNNHR